VVAAEVAAEVAADVAAAVVTLLAEVAAEVAADVAADVAAEVALAAEVAAEVALEAEVAADVAAEVAVSLPADVAADVAAEDVLLLVSLADNLRRISSIASGAAVTLTAPATADTISVSSRRLSVPGHGRRRLFLGSLWQMIVDFFTSLFGGEVDIVAEETADSVPAESKESDDNHLTNEPETVADPVTAQAANEAGSAAASEKPRPTGPLPALQRAPNKADILRAKYKFAIK